MLVTKLAAILRVANALDAEHLGKVRDMRLERGPKAWLLQLDATGDITLEQMAATARADLFVESLAANSSSDARESGHDVADQ